MGCATDIFLLLTLFPVAACLQFGQFFYLCKIILIFDTWIMYTNKEIINVSYPIFLGLLAQNIINVTDTAFLGHLSEVALGASAMGGMLYICLFTLAFGFSIGSQIMIARRNGEKEYRMIGPIMWQGSAFSLIMAMVLLGVVFFIYPVVIRWLVSSDAIFDSSCEFFRWRMWGFLFAFVNVMFRSLYIGITRTKVLTLNALVMAAVNVFLDYALVFGECGFPQMGVAGAALASVVAEASSLIFFLLYTYLKVDLKKYGLNRFGQFDWDMVMRILRISCFTMLQYFLSFGVWFVFFIALERHGERALAVANIVRSVYIVLLIPVQTLQTAANTLASNLIGSGGTQFVMHLLAKISRMSFGVMVVCVGLCLVFPRVLLSVYTGEDALVAESMPALYVICVAILISAVANIYFNGISGTGNTQAALIVEGATLAFYAVYVIMVAWVFRAPVYICFSTEVVYYALMLVTSIVYFKKAKWQNKKI